MTDPTIRLDERTEAEASSEYGPEFYAEQKDGSLSSARVVLPLVFDVVRPQSVVDVGCGVGAWLRVARDLGAQEIVGFDGKGAMQSGLMFERTDMITIDLATEPPTSSRRFDLAICLEVAEHLDASRSDGIVDALCKLSDAVLFSAAIPGQLGLHHVNLQPQSAWAERFREHGYCAADIIRPAVWTDPRIEPWYRQNTLLFIRADRHDLVAASSQRSSCEPPLDLVHPDLLAYWVRVAQRPVSVCGAVLTLGRSLRAGFTRRLKSMRSGAR